MAISEPTSHSGTPLAPTSVGEPTVDPTVDVKRAFRPEACDDSLVLQITRDEESDLWDAAERFVYEEYRVARFAEESPRGWVEAAEPYRHGSTLHVMLDGDRVVGVIRTMFGTYDELPIGQFGRSIEVPQGRLAEVGSLAVSRDLRGLGIANELHRSAVQQAVETRCEAFCMLVEPWSFEFFRDVYGAPLVQSAPAREYMGSETVPAITDVAEMLLTWARNRPGMYRWFTEGIHPSVWETGELAVLLD